MNETGEFSSILRLEEEAPELAGAFLVSVVDGPDAGASVLVDASLPCRVFVGSSGSCELRLDDGTVSRRHLALEIAAEKLRVTDLGSTSGTTAGGIVLVEGLVGDGELLRVGGTTLKVERRDALASAKGSRAERFGRAIGASPEMQRLYPLCRRLAAMTAPVLIEGESGTGKEVIAEALHEQGPRAERPFVVFDCVAVAPAHAARLLSAAFERAHGGTLLIDEIGDLDMTLQRSLVDLLRRGDVDVRILSTTRCDLDRLVEAGRFAEDVLERISVARIELPPLRRRTGDIRRLALHFARELGGPAATLPPDLVARWESDPWPGNVRALRDAVARWLALDEVGAGVESAPAARAADAFLDEVLALGLPLLQAREKVIAELERRYVERVLADHGGSVARAVEASGIARRHFDDP